MELPKRISLELGDRSPAQVVSLLLTDCRAPDGQLSGLSDDFTQLQSLSLLNVGLTSLSRLPSLPRLRKLEVSDNSISGGLEVLSERSPALSHLNLSGNKIKELSVLEPLQSLKSLRSLDLLSCAVSSLDGYRDAVFKLLPQIHFLDGLDQDHNEAADSADEEEAGPPQDEEDEDEESDGDEDEEVGLSYLMKDGIQDEDDDGDYEEEEEDEDDEDEDDDADDGATDAQGEKRKREAEDEGDDDDDE